MARIVVLGAGVCGLAAGLMLRRDGHEVTLLERDRARRARGVDVGGDAPPGRVPRAMLAERCCLGSPAALDEPELAERVLELARDADAAPPPRPDRKRLLKLLA
jgi:glycine/D-amino acid oxidase-like deaminating enzyme